MDVSRLKKRDLKVWLPMLAGDEEVLCRYLPQSEFDSISERCTVIRFRSGKKVEERDPKKFRAELAQAVVIDWKGFEDEGRPYPCTPENIAYLMEECTEFRVLVMDAPLSLERMLAAEKEDSEKNSVTTSALAPTTQA